MRLACDELTFPEDNCFHQALYASVDVLFLELLCHSVGQCSLSCGIDYVVVSVDFLIVLCGLLVFRFHTAIISSSVVGLPFLLCEVARNRLLGVVPEVCGVDVLF